MRAIHLALSLGLAAALATTACAGEEALPEEQIIEHKLDTTQSRVLRDSDRPIEAFQVERDLGGTEQRLRSFKTREPNAAATPLLERQLDRLSRPTRLRQR